MTDSNVFIKLWNKTKKPVNYIKSKTEGPMEFMKTGRMGAIIAEVILSVQFFSWIMKDMLYIHMFPAIMLSLLVVLLFVELLCLVIRIVFGGVNRSNIYFITAFTVILTNNLVANQFNDVVPAILMTFALALSCDVTGRCMWAFIKCRKFKQVFAYVALTISFTYIIFFAVFFHMDNFGKDRVAFYNLVTNSVHDSDTDNENVKDFDKYLENGSYEVASLSYGPESSEDIVTTTVDFTKFDSYKNRNPFQKFTEMIKDYDFAQTPIKGKIWYPLGQKNCPVLFFVHGNHIATTPSYLGYEYLGEYLASNGYVVVSVDENIINCLEEGNDKRAILFLDNMKTLLAENKNEDSPINGLIDPDRIAIGGHSRGGEMAATAYLFNDLDVYPEDGNVKFNYHFNISSIVAIAPCVDQYMPVGHSVRISDVNYLLLHGSNDQDVSVDMGEKQYNNISFTNDKEEFNIKTSVYILGANHGQFNSLWGRYDLEGATNGYINTNNFIDESDQKLIAKAYIRTFLDTTLGVDITYQSLLSDASDYRGVLPKTVYVTNYQNSNFKPLWSFDDTTDIGSYGDVKLNCTDMDTWTIDKYSRGDCGEREDDVLVCNWHKDSKPAINIWFPEVDISEGAISFRMADMRSDTEELREGLDYTVELTDIKGRKASVKSPKLIYPCLAVQLYKQDLIWGSYEYKKQLATINITPSMFETSDFDFADVVSMKITTDGTKDGKIIINDIGYWE